MRVQIEIKQTKEVEITTLHVKAGVRYFEDSIINGVADESGDSVPCKIGDLWCPIIDIDSGVIINWDKGKTANIHYKVCDCLGYEVIDIEGNIIASAEDGYVPDTLCPKEQGDGDYIIMDVDANGKIADWEFNFSDFEKIEGE